MALKTTSSNVLNYGLASALLFYLFLIASLVVSLFIFIEAKDVKYIFESKEVLYSFFLSLVTATISSFFSVIFAIPIGYVLSRKKFFGRKFAEALIDIPIILPPLVVGLSLLIFFNQTLVGVFFEKHVGCFFQNFAYYFPEISSLLGLEQIQGITYDLPAIVLAQFTVVCAFAIRTMRLTFDQIDPKYEEVARVYGHTPFSAFMKVSLPLSLKGIYASFALSWARALG